MDEAMGDSSTSLPVLSASETDQQQQAVGPPVYCQVLGCGVLLTGGKTYCIKKRACTTHIQADSVSLSEDSTTLHRFCQQCGKFEAIHKFDGTKRSCRARLAKRRSGTRALLQKKGCKDSHHNGTDQGAAAAAATAAAATKASSCSQHTDIYSQDNELTGFSAQQQLMMMYGHHQNSNEALLTLLSLPDDAAAEAAPGMQHSSSSGPIGAPARSLSDGTPMASASAAAVAAAANAAAAAAAHQAISAPLYLLPRSGTGTSDAAGMPHQAAAAHAAGCGGEDGPMGQAEVLKALQALEDPSDPLQRIQGSATSAVQAVACAGAPTPPPATGYLAAEITSCSVPLAQLDLGSSGALPKAVPAPGSPMRSAGGAPCKSAPLAGLGLGPSLGLGPLQHQASTASQQQQGSMERAGSRLKWLIQQLQQELDVCNPAELEALNNDELGTLLCAALAPATTNTAAAAGGDAAAARGAHARATVPVKPDPAAASLASLMPPAQPCFSAGFAPAAIGGPALGPSHVSDLDLQLQKAHVQQLQQRVHQLQMQLHIRDGGSSRPGDMQCATPPLAGNCPGMAAVYRGLSGMPDAQGVGGPFTSMQQRPLDSLLFGTGAASMSAPLQTPIMSGQHMPAGSMPAAAAAASQTRMDPNAAQWGMGHGVGGGISQPLAMPTGFSHVQQAQQRLQQVQQQAMGLQMAAASAGMQRQPDAAAAMQFMALQNQLRMVEEEMLSLMAQQSAAAR